jgi:hypothetical protein
MGRMLIDNKKPVFFFHQNEKPKKPSKITNVSSRLILSRFFRNK